MQSLLLAFLVSLLYFFLSFTLALDGNGMLLIFLGITIIMCTGWIVSTINICYSKYEKSKEKDI